MGERTVRPMRIGCTIIGYGLKAIIVVECKGVGLLAFALAGNRPDVMSKIKVASSPRAK
jgi:hypothetical protein